MSPRWHRHQTTPATSATDPSPAPTPDASDPARPPAHGAPAESSTAPRATRNAGHLQILDRPATLHDHPSPPTRPRQTTPHAPNRPPPLQHIGRNYPSPRQSTRVAQTNPPRHPAHPAQSRQVPKPPPTPTNAPAASRIIDPSPQRQHPPTPRPTLEPTRTQPAPTSRLRHPQSLRHSRRLVRIARPLRSRAARRPFPFPILHRPTLGR